MTALLEKTSLRLLGVFVKLMVEEELELVYWGGGTNVQISVLFINRLLDAYGNFSTQDGKKQIMVTWGYVKWPLR